MTRMAAELSPTNKVRIGPPHVGHREQAVSGQDRYGIVGRDAASVAHYISDALKKLRESGFVWTEENMDKWIADPEAILPNSPMAVAFRGIPDANERADIIAYLKTQ